MENVIHMQEINGVIYPTDYRSMDILHDVLNKRNVDADLFDIVSGRLVREGYMVAIENSTIKPYVKNNPIGRKVGGEVKCFEDPCNKCYLKGLCDDYCARYKK